MDIINYLNDSLVNDVSSLGSELDSYGIILSKEEVLDLVNTRNEAIDNFGLIEIGESAVKLILIEFCKSSYIGKEEYFYVVNELVYIFYMYRQIISDKVSDKELVSTMYNTFEYKCNGSVELLKDFLFGGSYE